MSVLTCVGSFLGGRAEGVGTQVIIVHMADAGLVSRGMAKSVAIREGNGEIESVCV